VPGVGDTADSNGFTVTIDTDVTCTSLINTHASAGSFSVTATGRTINANIVATGRFVLAIGTGSPGNLTTINGNVTGGSSSGVVGISYTGFGNVTINGNVTGGSASSGHGMNVQGAAAMTVTVNGNVLGGSGVGANGIDGDRNNTWIVSGTVTGGSNTNAVGLNARSAGCIVTVGGAISGGGAAGASGVAMISSGLLTANGPVLGGTNATAYGISRTGNGLSIVNNTVTGSANAHGINLAALLSASVTVVGAAITGGSAANVCGINNAGTGSIQTTSNIVGGSAAGAYGVANASTGPVILLGTATNNTANAINHAGAGVTYSCGVSSSGGGRGMFPGVMG